MVYINKVGEKSPPVRWWTVASCVKYKTADKANPLNYGNKSLLGMKIESKGEQTIVRYRLK